LNIFSISFIKEAAMKSFYITLSILILVTINLYPQFEIKDREINDPKFLNEDLTLTKPQARIDPILLDSMITSIMQISHIPGLAALIVKNDSIVWSGNYGYANVALNQPVEDSTLFLMASISKTFMVTAIMQLWEDGLFNLDDNINDYLHPDFQVFNPNHPTDMITFKMIMTHTSSIDDNWGILGPLCICGDSPIPLDSFFVNYFTPGEIYYNPANFLGYSPNANEYHYTNVGSCILAYIVERLSGVPFDQYCRDNVFNPLNITEASWFLEGLDINNIATPYEWADQYIGLCHSSWPLYPISHLRINKLELNKLLSTYMNWGTYNGTTILDSTTVNMMLSDQMGHPDPSGDYQGLIWYKTQFDGRWLWGHTGGWDGCSTAMFFVPEEDWGVILFHNSRPDYQGFWGIFQLICDYANLYGNIYAIHTKINKPYMKPSYDTLIVRTEFSNINQYNFTSNAIYVSSDGSSIDSIALYDDGIHGDSLAGDGIWCGFIHSISMEEFYDLGISTVDTETDKYFYTGDLTKFTTAGPVAMDSLKVTRLDSNTLVLHDIYVTNKGESININGIQVKSKSIDSCATTESGIRHLGNLNPSETRKLFGTYSFNIYSCNSDSVSLAMEIYSDGVPYWESRFKVEIPIVGIEDIAEGLPTEYLLSQNYPNPFNPTTTLKYQIPDLPAGRQGLSFVTLKIYDVLGSEVMTLVNEEKPAGSYEVDFNATTLPSGIYFYRIQTGDFTETKKMVLLR
jgi:CubicO group peptidase (beta-lactamase class C family)